MKREDNIGIWVATGIAGSIVLGIFLILFRESTSASNLAFIFLVWTFFIAELGGRIAAITTATLSAVSLNFFLTRPYLSLEIYDRDDLIAFIALIAVGLVAAYFGKRRKKWEDSANQSTQDLHALETAAKALAQDVPLHDVLLGLRSAFHLKGLAVRDASGALLASVPSNLNLKVPETRLALNELFSPGETELKMGRRGFLLPEDGGRLMIPSDGGMIAINMWGGDPEGYSLDQRQAMVVAAMLLARSAWKKEK